MWITCIPLVWLVIVTFTAAWQKIFSASPSIGFLAQALKLQADLDRGLVASAATTRTLIFNAKLDAAVCGILLVLVAAIIADSLRVWYGILTGTGERELRESPFVVSQLRADEL
jgi:carbon starvation protein